MELPVHMSLGELRSAIKDFKKTAPKLTSKKADLMSFASKVGIFKKSESESSSEDEKPSEKLVKSKKDNQDTKKKSETKSEKKSEKKSETKSELPEVLKKPSEKKSKKAEPETPKKKGSPFSAYMASMKGKGYSMSQLAQMYKDQKD
jgi:hypothetical protein